MKELGKLFVELSNPNRLNILEALSQKDAKLSQLSNELDIPTPEVSRNLNRLSDSGLVKKASDGRYKISSVGDLIVEIFPYFNFIFKNRETMNNHSISPIPKDLIFRGHPLAECEIKSGSIEGFNLSTERFRKTKKFCWIMSKETMESFISPLGRVLQREAEMKVILPEKEIEKTFEIMKDRGDGETKLKEWADSVESRALEKIEQTILVDENSAEFNLPDVEGEIDYSLTFYSEKESFRQWVCDIFEHFWNKARPVNASIYL